MPKNAITEPASMTVISRRRRVTTTSSLQAALRSAAEGLQTLEAAAGLIIAKTPARRQDFASRLTHHATGTPAIDREAAAAAMPLSA
jgi:hypothetical protein